MRVYCLGQDLLVHLARRCLEVQQQLQLSQNRPQQLRHHSPMQLSLLHQPSTLRVLRLATEEAPVDLLSLLHPPTPSHLRFSSLASAS